MNPINEVQDIWAYLRTTPLLWLMLTMMAYLLGFWCFEKVKRSPIVSPVAIAASFLGVILLITDTPYAVYFEGAQFVHFLLGPATVSLAIPLVANFPRVRRAAIPMLAALIASSATAIF
ncbi:MAG: LrgB family protein, partial [SAR324 cluster bacterium]|nr:LrgB family protein [SAR324 cluster bacterium]